MTKIKGLVQDIQEKLNGEGEKYYLLEMLDSNYNLFFINSKEGEKFKDKIIEVDCWSKDNLFYNILENRIKVIEGDKEVLISDINHIMDNVVVRDIIQNKKGEKTLILKPENSKVKKVKIKNSENRSIDNLKKQLLNKIINVHNISMFYSEQSKTKYRSCDFKNIKLVSKK